MRALDKTTYTVIGVILLLFATGVRLHDLQADPPAYFADGSQDVTTDGAYLTFHARNLVLFGQADLFDYRTWPAFKYSVVSGLAYVVFSLLGVSRMTANLVGTLLSLSSLVIFLFVLVRRTTMRAALVCAVFLGTDFLIWVYGRLPFSENGLMFMASLVFLVYSFWFDRAWGKVLVGLLIASAGMFGKSFGFLLMIGPVAAVLIENRRDKWKNILSLLAPAVALIATIQFTLYGDQNFFSFLWEHGAGEHGAPHGLSSVPAFFETLIAFGRKGLHSYSPVVSVLAGLMLMAVLLQPRGKMNLSRTELFMICWLVGSTVFMSPFNYQPLRYHFLLIIPMSILSGLLLDRVRTITIGGLGKLSWWRLIVLFLLLWYLLHYVFIHPFNSDVKFPEYYRTVWYSAAGAFAAAFVLVFTLKNRTLGLTARLGPAAIALALSISVVVQGVSFYNWYRTRSYNIEEAAADLSLLVSPDAVISGQYGPALAAAGKLRSFPYFLSSDFDATAATFRQYPVTHIAVSSSTWESYCQAVPALRRAPLIGRYWLRDSPVYVIRIASLFGNPMAAVLPITEFECAVDFRSAQKADSARIYLDKFLQLHPNSKQALMQSFELAFQSEPARRARSIVERLAATYPTDFVTQFMGASYFHWLAATEKSEQFERIALDYLAMAIRQSPQNEENLTKMYEFNPPDAPVIR